MDVITPELHGGVLNRVMTHCSDNENDEQDDGAEKPSKMRRGEGGKHVSFPPDEQIVSGFAEHKNNDRRPDSCLTLTEVMVAYQQNCDRHQVQPRAHILRQLQLSREDQYQHYNLVQDQEK
uniref:protein phosphatase 1 regulatory subunit 37-like n=1 Tax=Monopterus albus TaxID=43700 RepID=UPI0009B40F81|nr:protein phosphatase 1 regulatory subunit 37-like [Monopterus albus]